MLHHCEVFLSSRVLKERYVADSGLFSLAAHYSDAISNTSSAILGNLTFRCADVKTFRPGSNILRVRTLCLRLPAETLLTRERFRLLTVPLLVQRNGNGFSRIDPTQVSSAGPVVSAALERLPVGGAYTSDRSLATNLTYLDGANPVFLAWMAGMGNFDVRRPPPSPRTAETGSVDTPPRNCACLDRAFSLTHLRLSLPACSPDLRSPSIL